MSEPLSKVFQFKRKPSPTYFPANEGYNLCLDELDQRSPDVVKLAKVLFDRGIKIVGFTSTGWEDLSAREKIPYLGEAQEIINKMSVWLVKKG